MDGPARDVTQLLSELSGGNKAALEELVPLLYPELRRLASAYLRRERPDHTLQATALVHEAYLKLVDQNSPWVNRYQFLGVAAQLMRRILADYGRARRAAKRGGEEEKIYVEEATIAAKQPMPDVVALDEALSRLAQVDAQQSRVVELRFFGGLSIEQVAEALEISPATVKRDWNVAKAWLGRELAREQEPHA